MCSKLHSFINIKANNQNYLCVPVPDPVPVPVPEPYPVPLPVPDPVPGAGPGANEKVRLNPALVVD